MATQIREESLSLLITASVFRIEAGHFAGTTHN